MNNRPAHESLEDVLNAYLDAVPEPTAGDVAEWIRRYPHFRQELSEFAASQVLTHWLPPIASPRSEAALAQEGIRIGREVLRRKHEQRAVPPPPASLLTEGARYGHTIGNLADLTDLSVVLWRKLDRRLIAAATIPGPVVEAVARAVRRSTVTVRRYLSLPPKFAAAAQHRAGTVPTLSEPENFFDAVRNDLTLLDDRRQRLLALEASIAPDAPDQPS